jgi:hypothetical protein
VAPALQVRSEDVLVPVPVDPVSGMSAVAFVLALPAAVGRGLTGLFDVLGTAVAGAHAASTAIAMTAKRRKNRFRITCILHF